MHVPDAPGLIKIMNGMVHGRTIIPQNRIAKRPVVSVDKFGSRSVVE